MTLEGIDLGTVREEVRRHDCGCVGDNWCEAHASILTLMQILDGPKGSEQARTYLLQSGNALQRLRREYADMRAFRQRVLIAAFLVNALGQKEMQDLAGIPAHKISKMVRWSRQGWPPR